ncbi:MAG: amidohydrolase, partial [Burkholderiales bacterium]|nr:amidohydrolase [Burkholderiales bacterium]
MLTGGKIVTVDEQNPQSEAVAVKADRIIAVGSADQIAPYIGADTNVIQLDGRLVI